MSPGIQSVTMVCPECQKSRSIPVRDANLFQRFRRRVIVRLCAECDRRFALGAA